MVKQQWEVLYRNMKVLICNDVGLNITYLLLEQSAFINQIIINLNDHLRSHKSCYNSIVIIIGDNFNFFPMPNPHKELKLPNRFAEILLERQIEVKLSIQPIEYNVCSLLQMYSLGFQYYESLGSYKYRYFELKMKEIFRQTEEQNIQNKAFLANNYTEKEGIYPSISAQEMLRIEKKCLDEQRLCLMKQIQEKTSIKYTNQEIKSIILNGDFKGINIYTRVKFEVDSQEKLLQQKLQARHRRIVRNNSKKGVLKLSSTKTSLLSAQSKKEQQLEQIKQNMFQKFINENEDENPIILRSNNPQNTLQNPRPLFLYIKQQNQ